MNRAQQEKLLHWAAVASQTYAEIGYQIATLAPRAFALLDDAEFDAWVLAGLDAFDRHGGRAAMDLLRDYENFSVAKDGERTLTKFAEIEARLARFVQGLSGRPLGLGIGPGTTAWTDTETIFLPQQIVSMPQAEGSLYKVLTTILWAQTRFGTFGSSNIDLAAALASWPDAADRLRALQWLAVLESMRLKPRSLLNYPVLPPRLQWCAVLAVNAGTTLGAAVPIERLSPIPWRCCPDAWRTVPMHRTCRMAS